MKMMKKDPCINQAASATFSRALTKLLNPTSCARYPRRETTWRCASRPKAFIPLSSEKTLILHWSLSLTYSTVPGLTRPITQISERGVPINSRTFLRREFAGSKFDVSSTPRTCKPANGCNPKIMISAGVSTSKRDPIVSGNFL